MNKVDPKTIEHNWRAVSFRSERRAESAVAWFEEQCLEFAKFLEELAGKAGVDPAFDPAAELATFEKNAEAKHRAWWVAMGRCMSTMVTGPANFPERSNRKRQDTEHKRMGEVLAFPEIAQKAARRRAFPYGAPGEPVRSNNPDAIGLLEKKLAELEELQVRMKEINRLFRGKKFDELRELGYTDANFEAWNTPRWPGAKAVPFESYQLTNNNGKLKATRERLEGLRRARELEYREWVLPGLTAIQNPDEMRFQLLFDGKPEPEVRQVVKRRGFRWAPRLGVWQRQITSNGRAAFLAVIEDIKQMESA